MLLFEFHVILFMDKFSEHSMKHFDFLNIEYLIMIISLLDNGLYFINQ